MAMRGMTAGLALGLALGLWAGDAAAQHANDAQQMAYAKAFHGRWSPKNSASVEFELKNDGKEVRFALMTVNQQLGEVGFKVNDVIYQGSFNGPEFKGWSLVAFHKDV